MNARAKKPREAECIRRIRELPRSETHRTRVLLNDLQHRARREILTPDFAALAHRAKDLPLGAGRGGPPVDRCFDLGRDSNRTKAISLSGDVDNHPAVLAPGDRSDLYLGNQLRPSQPTIE